MDLKRLLEDPRLIAKSADAETEVLLRVSTSPVFGDTVMEDLPNSSSFTRILQKRKCGKSFLILMSTQSSNSLADAIVKLY